MADGAVFSALALGPVLAGAGMAVAGVAVAGVATAIGAAEPEGAATAASFGRARGSGGGLAAVRAGGFGRMAGAPGCSGSKSVSSSIPDGRAALREAGPLLSGTARPGGMLAGGANAPGSVGATATTFTMRPILASTTTRTSCPAGLSARSTYTGPWRAGRLTGSSPAERTMAKISYGGSPANPG